jgi:hypothetical protein
MFNLSNTALKALILVLFIAFIGTLFSVNWGEITSVQSLLGPIVALFLMVLFSVDLFQKKRKENSEE